MSGMSLWPTRSLLPLLLLLLLLLLPIKNSWSAVMSADE
jgi:hypothetical protein